MGFIVKKKIYSYVTNKIYDSFYCRLENVLYKKQTGQLSYLAQFYYSKAELDSMYSEYIEDGQVSESAVLPVECHLIVSSSVSGSEIVDVDENGDDIYGLKIELPLSNNHYVTQSFELIQDIYETQDVYNTITYTDYDDEGNLVEKTREEYSGSVEVKVGEETVIKSKVNHDLILSSSIYDVAYDLARERLANFFGEGTIEDFI